MRPRVPAELVLIGAGPLRDRLEAEARAAGVRAEFPGVVDHQLASRAGCGQADAFVLPSFTEGHPEGPARGDGGRASRASASDCPGNRALVRDGETGLLFDARDPAALAARLERVLTDETLASVLGHRGHDLVGARLRSRPPRPDGDRSPQARGAGTEGVTCRSPTIPGRRRRNSGPSTGAGEDVRRSRPHRGRLAAHHHHRGRAAPDRPHPRGRLWPGSVRDPAPASAATR